MSTRLLSMEAASLLLQVTRIGRVIDIEQIHRHTHDGPIGTMDNVRARTYGWRFHIQSLMEDWHASGFKSCLNPDRHCGSRCKCHPSPAWMEETARCDRLRPLQEKAALDEEKKWLAQARVCFHCGRRGHHLSKCEHQESTFRPTIHSCHNCNGDIVLTDMGRPCIHCGCKLIPDKVG